MRLELNLASCSPIPVSRPLTYTIIVCGRERESRCFKTFAGKRGVYFSEELANMDLSLNHSDFDTHLEEKRHLYK
jgi:hypothetical protein